MCRRDKAIPLNQSLQKPGPKKTRKEIKSARRLQARTAAGTGPISQSGQPTSGEPKGKPISEVAVKQSVIAAGKRLVSGEPDWQVAKVAEATGQRRQVILVLNEDSLELLKESEVKLDYGHETITIVVASVIRL
ncbi:uncharacterized protein DMAD_07904 [Drosophila madeirensis]|uniref:Uncharacterized protein n=1 Tax=Drosophila madeirensis TaxID=30013 RepID=A0AAU9EQ20_DROMD